VVTKGTKTNLINAIQNTPSSSSSFCFITRKEGNKKEKDDNTEKDIEIGYFG